MTQKVLIVDDEQFVRVSLRTLYAWENNGFEIVDTADDGLDALVKIERHKPDIVITDIAMPNMDGLALLEEIRARKLPCVSLVISNLGDLQNVKAALKLGAEDYFLKVDFEREEFHNVMQRLKETVRKKKLESFAAGRTSPAAPDSGFAGILAAAVKNNEPEALEAMRIIHVFCVRVREYISETLSSFQSVYPLMGNIVKEAFKARQSVSFAKGPWDDSLLITVCEVMPAASITDMMKRLDGQIKVYLQARSDIFHFSNAYSNDNRALFEKLKTLSGEF